MHLKNFQYILCPRTNFFKKFAHVTERDTEIQFLKILLINNLLQSIL